jgi:hypothetical protein
MFYWNQYDYDNACEPEYPEYPDLPDDRYCEVFFDGSDIDIVVEGGVAFPLFFDEDGNVVDKEYDENKFSELLEEFKVQFWESLDTSDY